MDDTKGLFRCLADEGSLVRAGCETLMTVWVPDATDRQREMLRDAFYAGAHWALEAVRLTASEGDEVTEDDERRVGSLYRELEAFDADFRARHGLPPARPEAGA